MTLQEYINDPCPDASLSASIAHILLTQSPLHAFMQHPKLNPNRERDESAKADIGTIAHGMLLENDESRIVVIDADDWRTKAAKDARDAAYAAGKIPMLAKQERPIRKMVDEARKAIANSELADAFADGKPEQTLMWQEDDIWLRGRADWLTNNHDLIVDYKTTTASAEPNSWMRTALGNGNDLQAALYVRGIQRLFKPRSVQFVFLVQEQNAPYAVSFVGLDPVFLDMAEHKLERAIALWRDCLTMNVWPAYPSRICWMSPPAWAYTEEEFKS